MGMSMVFSLFLNCILLQGLLADQTEEQLLAWQAPQNMTEDCPYYLLSYDGDSPLWLIPFGTWKDGEYLSDFKSRQLLSKYTDQGVARAIVSGRNNSGFRMIVDLEGMNGGILDPKFPFFVEKTGAVLKTLNAKELKYFWLINGNALFKTVVETVKLLLGPKVGAKVHAFNTDESEKATKSMLGQIAKENLPEKYGGTAQFNPVQTHG